MWLYVIGCPSEVRSKISLLSSIHNAFSKLKSFDVEEIIDMLKWEGFRPSLARWMCDHCSEEDFEDDVLNLATPTSSNSYLFSNNSEFVHYTHLHYGSCEFESVKPEPVNFSVQEIRRDDIRSLPLAMGSNSWAAVDFAKETFNKLRSLVNNPAMYILGHCCPEQSVINMSKKGMSTLATYQSDKTCGHGMYFFELHWDVFQLPFEDLNTMPLHQDQPDGGDGELDPRGLQFRAFVHALTRVFQNQNCDALSPSVLVFLLSKESADSIPEPFDAVSNRLPMCNDDMSDTTSWTCTCPPLFSYEVLEQSIKPIIDKDQPMTASAIRNAISLIEDDDIEKINAFALLGGIVDFHKIPNGAYTSIISDKSPQKILRSLINMDIWDTNKFEVWTNLLQEPSASFRRPKTLFNHQGGVSHFQPDNFIRQGREHCPADPIRETVFVQNFALGILLEKATTIHVVFLDPGNEWTQRLPSECNLKETEGTAYTYAIAMAAVNGGKAIDSRHLYWKIRSSCRCIDLNILL